jgi:hypothetical protein
MMGTATEAAVWMMSVRLQKTRPRMGFQKEGRKPSGDDTKHRRQPRSPRVKTRLLSLGLVVEAAFPALRFAKGLGRGAGEDRRERKPSSDEAKTEQRESEFSCDRPQCFGSLRSRPHSASCPARAAWLRHSS